MTTIPDECRRIAKLLDAQERKLVLVESCTAGLIAASLGKVPGISRNFCGSLVTYRSETKAAWLKISSATLVDPGPVSESVARLMVEEALSLTPEANLAASVTGHLGPQAPANMDGLVFIGVAQRVGDKVSSAVTRFQLEKQSRTQRQREATTLVLTSIRQTLLGVW
jgi:nicotinamide-nucleotide amidase